MSNFNGLGTLLRVRADYDILLQLFKKFEKSNVSYVIDLRYEITADERKKTLNDIVKVLQYVSKLSEDKVPKLFIMFINSHDLSLFLTKGRSDLRKFLKGFVLPDFVTSVRGYDSIMYTYPDYEYIPLIGPRGRESNSVQEYIDLKYLMHSVGNSIYNCLIDGDTLRAKYGIRPHVLNTIYDSVVIAKDMANIIDVFGDDWNLIAPSYEYYDDELYIDEIEDGLTKEARLDVLNGFIGKAAIHPEQVRVIEQEFKPNDTDYNEALVILDSENYYGYKFNDDARRVCNYRNKEWANRIKTLSEMYGHTDYPEFFR